MANQKGMADVKPGPYSRVKGGGGQNAGSAKTMSGGNKRGGKSGSLETITLAGWVTAK